MKSKSSVLAALIENYSKTLRLNKFAQMAGESATALALYNNVGSWVSVADLPTNKRVCCICGDKATQAEHLVNKAHGGNHTPHNVVPVCAKHKKPGGNKHWTEYYTLEEQKLITALAGTDEDLRYNPYHEQNLLLVEDLRSHIKASVLEWRKKNGMIDA